MLQSPLELLPVSVASALESSTTSSTNCRTCGSMEQPYEKEYVENLQNPYIVPLHIPEGHMVVEGF